MTGNAPQPEEELPRCSANSRGAWKKSFATREAATQYLLNNTSPNKEKAGLPPYVYDCAVCKYVHIATRGFGPVKPRGKTRKRKRKGSGQYGGA